MTRARISRSFLSFEVLFTRFDYALEAPDGATKIAARTQQAAHLRAWRTSCGQSTRRAPAGEVRAPSSAARFARTSSSSNTCRVKGHIGEGVGRSMQCWDEGESDTNQILSGEHAG